MSLESDHCFVFILAKFSPTPVSKKLRCKSIKVERFKEADLMQNMKERELRSVPAMALPAGSVQRE